MFFVKDFGNLQLNIVAFLVVLGESSVLREAQAASFSLYSLVPRLLPAPQALLRHERPARLPVKSGTIVGAYSGRVRHEINFLAQVLHPRHLDAYVVKVVEVTRNKGTHNPDNDEPDDSYEANSYGPSFWLSLVGLSMAITLTILSILWNDGMALIATLLLSSLSTVTGIISKGEVKNDEPPPKRTKIPDGDVVIYYPSGAFLIVQCEDHVARLYFAAERCKYFLTGRIYQATALVGTLLLMFGMITLGNATVKLQACFAAAYIILNALYWLSAALEEASRWKTSYTVKDKEFQMDMIPDRNYKNFTAALWQVIAITGTAQWVSEASHIVPTTPAWKIWVKEAWTIAAKNRNMNRSASDVIIVPNWQFQERLTDLLKDHKDLAKQPPRNIEPLEAHRHLVQQSSVRETPGESELTKIRTLRIKNIPKTTTREMLKEQLERLTIDSDTECGNATVHSLAPYLSDCACATVTFKNTLSNKQKKISGFDFDDHFLGFTPLYEYNGEGGPSVDIIAVPGLGSHPLGSWKSKDGYDVWLRDYLPNDLKNIRIILYGYDSTLLKSDSNQSISDLSKTLLETIKAHRNVIQSRPVIFIGHSLGGLLIKEALVIAARSDGSQENLNLFNACYGLIFFGVPNLGLRNNQLEAMVDGQPNEQLIRDLVVDKNSEARPFLLELSQKFEACCKTQHFQVVSYYETLDSPTIREDKSGKWTKTGEKVRMVTRDSATRINLDHKFHDQLPINADHSGMVKFSDRHGTPYEGVLSRIRGLVDEASETISKR